jgi:hypothetical protein
MMETGADVPPAEQLVMNEDDDSTDGDEDLVEDMSKHPVSSLWKAWKGSNKKQRSTFDFQPFRENFQAYLFELKEEDYCFDVSHTGRQSSCTCMRVMPLVGTELARVLSALVRFSTKTKLERNHQMAEWIRYANCYQSQGRGVKAYLLPGGSHLICQNALSRVCGMKSYAWRGLCKKVRDGVALDHGLTGKNSNRADPESQEWMDSFLSRLEEQGIPRATRVVRYLNNDGNYVQETRDHDIDSVDLPSHCTKLGLYKQFVAEHGWKFVYDPKNRIMDKVAIEGMEQDPEDVSLLPSIKSFLGYWEKHFPKMKIQPPSADICDDCFVFANQVRYKERLTGKEGTDALNDEMEDDEIPSEAVKEKEGDMLKSEALILAAAEHVDKQQKQRALFRKLKHQARNQNYQAARLTEIHTFVADYAQNMGVPNLAGEQPGKAYYLSPLSAFVFGVVDCSKQKTTLAAHTYFETDGKKGGNNVASMLWNELARKGLTTTGQMVQEINFIMDNCGGQNKNRMVLRMLFVLVKLKLCFKARMVFLVKGHTKNDCDRMFNLMKMKYRNTNCYTPKQLLEFVENSHEDVELVDVMNGGGGFKDWDKAQNKYMRTPDSIQKFHVFAVNIVNPDRLMCQEADDYPIHFDDKVIKKQFRNQPWGDTFLEELQPIQPTGMKDIKWITLYDEWRALVPMDHRKDYSFFHQDPGDERREKTRLNRGEAATTRKQRAITINSEPPKKKPAPKKPAAKKTPAAAKHSKKPAAAKKMAAAKKPAAKKTAMNDKKKSGRANKGPFVGML